MIKKLEKVVMLLLIVTICYAVSVNFKTLQRSYINQLINMEMVQACTPDVICD